MSSIQGSDSYRMWASTSVDERGTLLLQNFSFTPYAFEVRPRFLPGITSPSERFKEMCCSRVWMWACRNPRHSGSCSRASWDSDCFSWCVLISDCLREDGSRSECVKGRGHACPLEGTVSGG